MGHDREFEVQYNANDLDVIDLCAFTKKPELGIGIPDGTTISIVEYSPGIIRFTMNPSIPVDKKWSGISNVIIFRSKINGQTSVNYSCE